ncbi:MAG: cation transporting ATPase C-terminal domain-containing protein, partial [Planctomycetota bacterium]
LSANPLLIASIVAAQAVHIAAMHLPLTQHVLNLNPVSFMAWAGVTALAASVFLLGEAYKLFVARPRARREKRSQTFSEPCPSSNSPTADGAISGG